MAITNGTDAAAAEPVSAARSWRDVLPVHPAADLFPLMSEAELRELGEDIKKNGQTVFIAFLEVAKSPVKIKGRPVVLLDGRNRLDAYEATTGHKIDFEIMHTVGENGNLAHRILWTIRPANTDPYAYVISANIQRRHLTAEQKRDLIAKVLKAKPDLSNNAIAKQVKADDKTVAKVRNELQANSDIPNKTERTEASGRKARGRKPKAKAESPSQEEKKQEPKASTPPKPVQEVFDSPQAAHAKPDALNLGSLSIAWREVEAHAAAGNKQRLKSALQHLLKEVSGALARMRKGGAQ